MEAATPVAPRSAFDATETRWHRFSDRRHALEAA